MATQQEEFIGEQMTPLPGTGDAAAMARGEPGLPGRFLLHGVEYRVAAVLETWKTSGPCRNGSNELYLRRHWFRVLTERAGQAPPADPAPPRPREVLTIYFDRQARNRKRPTARWWVYSRADDK